MAYELWYILAMSFIICGLNYIACYQSNLSALRALLMDSFVDLVFPILSAVAINSHNSMVNSTVAVIQSFLMLIMSIYFVNKKLKQREEPTLSSTVSIITMTFSILLTCICLWLTDKLASYGPSLEATGAHFRIDLVLKISVILISIVHMMKISRKIKSFVITGLDLLSMIYVFCVSLLTMMHVLSGHYSLYFIMPIIVGFLLGAIPFSVIVPLFLFNIDITQLGSRNPGATNVNRVVSKEKGEKWAKIITLIVGGLDVFKGILPSLIFPGSANVACVAAVFGHAYSPFLGFKGGKSVATFFGALVGITRKWQLIAPCIAWELISFNKFIIYYLPFKFKDDYVIIKKLWIKETFFVTLLCMLYGVILSMFFVRNYYTLLQIVTLFLFVCYRHKRDVHLE